jgi:hypothetical protein
VAVLAGVVVVMPLGFSAPAFAHGPDHERGEEHGRDDRPRHVVDERGNSDLAPTM